MSTHKVEIIEIGEVLPHPNPDSTKMEIIHVFGWQCCIGKDQFKKGDKAIFIPPDFCVSLSHPSFEFLKRDGEDKQQQRIKVRKFKGALSQGLIVPVPLELSHLPIGTNVIEQLGIERYEPPLPKSTGGMFIGRPSGLWSPKFDVESFQRYYQIFEECEPVVVTEKLHGASSRFVFAKDKDDEWKQFCGSRNNWMAEDEKNIWWMASRQAPDIGRWCEDHPELLLYGEVFGQVQKLKYGARKNDIFFAGFGILNKQTWLDYDECQRLVEGYNINWVPLLWRGQFDFEKILELAEGSSLFPNADHIREGCVVQPVHERRDEEIGRVILKAVSNRYLEKS